MSLSPRLRFEVLKRDGFRCAYCGLVAESSQLQVDHIVAKANGGLDEITNLITACTDCNQGKGARPLDHAVPAVTGEVVATLEDRVGRQVRYAEAVVAEREAREQAVEAVYHAWATAFHAEDRDGYWHLKGWEEWPDLRSVRKFVSRIPIDRMFQLVDYVRGKFDSSSSAATRYFYGVCWRVIKTEDVEHRLAVAEESLTAAVSERDELLHLVDYLDEQVEALQQRLDHHRCSPEDRLRIGLPSHVSEILRGIQ